MNTDNFPVKITSAPYSGDHPCTRCGQPVKGGQRIVGTKGPDVARWLILCPACYRLFAKQLPPGFGTKPA